MTPAAAGVERGRSYGPDAVVGAPQAGGTCVAAPKLNADSNIGPSVPHAMGVAQGPQASDVGTTIDRGTELGPARCAAGPAVTDEQDPAGDRHGGRG